MPSDKAVAPHNRVPQTGPQALVALAGLLGRAAARQWLSAGEEPDGSEAKGIGDGTAART